MTMFVALKVLSEITLTGDLSFNLSHYTAQLLRFS